MVIYRNNYTQIPNTLIENMSELSDIAFKVVMVICRKTIGYHKDTDSISVSQLVKISGLSKNSVLKSIKELEEKGLIVVDRVGDNYTTNTYTLLLAEEGGARDEPGVVHGVNRGVVHGVNTQNKVLNKNKEISHTPKNSDLFNVFWDAYGKKVGKSNTIKQWNKLSTEDQQHAVDKLQAYLKFRPDVQYRKDPERYLSQKIFYDDYLNHSNQQSFKDYK